jgi:hypothetical protein
MALPHANWPLRRRLLSAFAPACCCVLAVLLLAAAAPHLAARYWPMHVTSLAAPDASAIPEPRVLGGHSS